MGRGREGAALDGRALGAAVVPQDDLARIGAAQDQVGVEAREAARQHRRLAVEDVLGRLLLEARVPHLHAWPTKNQPRTTSVSS